MLSNRNMWTYDTFDKIMDSHGGTYPLRKANILCNILLSSICNHLNKKIRSKKMGPQGALTNEEHATEIVWTLVMHLNVDCP
jgi:hypothetical protein